MIAPIININNFKMSARGKPLVVALGDPKYVGEDFLDEFKKDFNLEVIAPDFVFNLSLSHRTPDSSGYKPERNSRTASQIDRRVGSG